MRTLLPVPFLLAAALVAAPALGYGPNLLANPGFATDLNGWENTPSTDWKATDSDGNPSSGSASLAFNGANGTYGPFQCIPVTAGTKYVASGSFFGPATLPAEALPRVLIRWRSGAACDNGLGGHDGEGSAQRDVWQDVSNLATAPAGAIRAQVWYGWYGPAGQFVNGALVDAAYFGIGSCAPSPTTLCLNQGRFAVSVQFNAAGQAPAAAKTIPLADDSGGFWFFDASNTELLVKVLNGCGLNSRYWVFAAGLTDVHVTISVTDTRTGGVRTYNNPLGHVFDAVTDTGAFATCP